MATLTIEGRSVTIDDAFLHATPEQQEATVNEIAQSLKLTPGSPQGGKGGMFSDVIPEIEKAAGSAIDAMSKVSDRGKQGPLEGMLTTGRAALAVPQLLGSPLAGLRSLLGHPIAAAETAVGGLINPKVAAEREASGAAYEDAANSVDTAMSAARAAGIGKVPALPGTVRGLYEIPETAPSYQHSVPGPAAAPAAPRPVAPVVEAAQRLSGVVGDDINVPRAIATDSMAAQRAGQGIRNLPIVGDAIPKATNQLVESLGDATKTVADQFGSGSGPNVANRIGQTIQGAAERETGAATNAARRSDEAVLAAWQRDVDAAHQDVAGREANSLQAARTAVGDMSPQDMGAALISRLRQGEREARATKERLYDIAAKGDGAIEAKAVRSLRGDVEQSLNEKGDVIDPVLTPAASRMMAELANAPLNMPGASTAEHAQNVADLRAKFGDEVASVYDRQKQAETPKAQSLTEFIASKGGLGPDAELEAIGAHTHTVNVEGVGRRKLVRQGGWPLDYAREAAEEAGYFRGGHNGTSTPTDLLDAIDAEMRGQKRYPEGFEGHQTKRENVARSEREQHEYEQVRQAFEDDLAAAGHGEIAPDVKQRAIELMANERMDPDMAVEHAMHQLDQEDSAALGGGFPGDRIERPKSATDPAADSVSMQSLERTRKRLNALSRAATNDADRRAAKRVISSFDDWLGNAFDSALFSGSDEALKAYRAARSANTDWRQKFGFNARDDADKVVNRIVTGEVTPQEVANYIVGASQVGAKGVSSRLLTRLAEATGDDPEALQAINGGIWNRLAGSTEGNAPKPPATVAKDIMEFLYGSGRDVAERRFTPDQRRLMRAYADTLRAGQDARALIGDVAAATKPGSTDVPAGPMKQLADAVIGKGGKSDEALFRAIDGYAKSGNRADVVTLAKLVQAIPQDLRTDLAGSIIRNIGISPRTGEFSPDVFVSQWKTYTPQAKTVLFGNAGPQRQAIDDIALISDRLKQVGSKFGNPSGTAQTANFAAGLGAVGGAVIRAFSGDFVTPLALLTSAVGGGIVAKILAAPAGAASAAKWSKAYATLLTKPSPQAVGLFQAVSRNLANTAQGIGVKVSAGDLARAVQDANPAPETRQQHN